MDGPRLTFDHDRELVFSDNYPSSEDALYLAEIYDTHEIKNTLWWGVRKVIAEHDEVFGQLDTKDLTIWLTPSYGPKGRSVGFLHYDWVPGNANVHIAFSLWAYDRIQTADVDEKDFIVNFVKHELCHLVAYNAFGRHEENDEHFHALLERVDAPTHVDWDTCSHEYNYTC